MPMHPLWQIRQAICIDSSFYVERMAVFGNTCSGDIFGAFMGLVVWIAVFIKDIRDLLAYVDNVFGHD